MTTTYTTHLRFPKPDFRSSPWHSELQGAIDAIDAAVYRALSQASVLNNFNNWANATIYKIGDIRVDTADGTAWMVAVAHTSVAAPTTFAATRITNPTYWGAVTVGFTPRGAWLNSTQYRINEISFNSTLGILGVALNTHVSSASPATIIDDAANWTFIVNVASLQTLVTAAAASATSAAASKASVDASLATVVASAAQVATDAAATASFANRLIGIASTTSFAMALGSKVFTVAANLGYAAGQFVLGASNAGPTIEYWHGQITAYTGTSLTIDVQTISNGNTRADWTIRLSGPKGAAGAAGSGSGDMVTDDIPTTPEQILGYGAVDKHLKGKSIAALLAGAGINNVQAVFGPWSGVVLAAASDISAANTIFVKITAGTGPITSFGATRDGYLRIVRADVAFTITRDAINLETPNSANLDVAVGDYLIVVRDSSEATAKTRVVSHTPADGRASRGPNRIPQNLSLDGIISPTQLLANTNDYNPTNHQTALIERISTDASRNITGLTAPTSGRAEVRILENVGAFPAVLTNEDVSSVAANRFLLGANLTLAADHSIILVYDVTSSRWRPLNKVLPFGALAILDRIVTIDQNLSLTGAISPAQLTVNTNDWAPTGFSTSNAIRVSTDASRNLTGIAGGATGRTLLLVNVGSNALVLKSEDINSVAANRLGIGSDRTLAGADAALLWYDGTSSRWRCIAIVSVAAGGGGTTLPATNNGRISAATGVREHVAAVVAATSIFFGVWDGPYIALFDGTATWNLRSITSEKSIKITDAQTCTTTNASTNLVVADSSQLVVGMKVSGTGIQATTTVTVIIDATNVTLSLAANASGANTITFKCPANTGYDLYCRDVSSAAKLFMVARSALFTATSNTIQDGVPVKTGATTDRWLGWFRTGNTDGEVNYAESGQYRTPIFNQDNRLSRRHREYFTATGTWYKTPANCGKVLIHVGGGSSGTSSFGAHASSTTAGASGDLNLTGVAGVTASTTGNTVSAAITGAAGAGAGPYSRGGTPASASGNLTTEVWGATSSAAGGQGGGYSEKNVRVAALGTTETVTIAGSGVIVVEEVLEV